MKINANDYVRVILNERGFAILANADADLQAFVQKRGGNIGRTMMGSDRAQTIRAMVEECSKALPWNPYNTTEAEQVDVLMVFARSVAAMVEPQIAEQVECDYDVNETLTAAYAGFDKAKREIAVSIRSSRREEPAK